MHIFIHAHVCMCAHALHTCICVCVRSMCLSRWFSKAKVKKKTNNNTHFTSRQLHSSRSCSLDEEPPVLSLNAAFIASWPGHRPSPAACGVVQTSPLQRKSIRCICASAGFAGDAGARGGCVIEFETDSEEESGDEQVCTIIPTTV